MFRITNEIKYIIFSFIFLLGLLLIARFIQFVTYLPEGALPGEIIYAFYLGMKFDARMAAWAILPLVILFQTDKTSLISVKWSQALSRYYLQAIGIIFTFFAILDFEFYDYQNERLSAVITSYFDDINTSLGMVYEAYPVFLYFTLIILVATLQHKYNTITYKKISSNISKTKEKYLYKTLRQTIFVFLTLFVLYGNFSVYGLRWSNAFFTQNTGVSNLVFNPIHNLYDTSKSSKSNYDFDKTKKYYPLIAKYLGFKPNENYISFLRHYDQSPEFKPKNVVIIILESFSYYKTGSAIKDKSKSAAMNFNKIADESLLFTNHYVPVPGTSFSLWSLVTGIPDINPGSRASANPFVVDQRVIMNEFKGYDRYFFYSDNANWGNVRGFLSNNIEGLKMFESDDFEGKRISTWGVSDVRVFNKANEVFSHNKKPFVSIILTSGNHSPFKLPTDPDDLVGFEWVELTEEQLSDLGFSDNEEYNSFRYLDHSLGYFIRKSKKEEYFKDTLFVILGDHGDHRQSGVTKNYYGSEGINRFHVPLAFYSPGFIKPEKNDVIVSELDVFPTIAGMIGMEYNNYTLGRDVLNQKNTDNFAFVRSFSGRYGLFSDEYYSLMNGTTRKTHLYKPYSDKPKLSLNKIIPDIHIKMKNYINAFIETALYMLENNFKSRGY